MDLAWPLLHIVVLYSSLYDWLYKGQQNLGGSLIMLASSVCIGSYVPLSLSETWVLLPLIELTKEFAFPFFYLDSQVT